MIALQEPDGPWPTTLRRWLAEDRVDFGSDVIPAMLILTVWAVVAFLLAVRLFRWS